MIFISKLTLAKIRKEFKKRCESLTIAIEQRELINDSEGATAGSVWVEPRKVCVINSDIADIRLAIDDIESILNVVKKLR